MLALTAIAAAIAVSGCGGDAPNPGEGATGASAERTATEPKGEAATKKRPATNERGLRLRQLGSFREPIQVVQPPGQEDLLLIAEQRGVIRVMKRGRKRKRPFLDLRDEVFAKGTEQGLASVAFPPDYRRSRRFYVAYTDRSGGDLRVEEYRSKRHDPTRARGDRRRRLLEINQPNEIHNGGMLAFGPDRRLYIGTGDGGPSYDPNNVAQRRKFLLGKILRIEPRRSSRGRRYSIPPGNPFRGRGGRDEIYASGLRNPWRFSFDRKTGALIIGDVGQDEIEEIDYVGPKRARRANFGWSGFEGTRPFEPERLNGGAIKPLHEYTHEQRCAVTGGYVVRTAQLPSLRGRYLYGDYCDGELRSLIPPSDGPDKRDRREGLRVPALVSFGEDETGGIYAVSLEGPVYELLEGSGRAG